MAFVLGSSLDDGEEKLDVAEKVQEAERAEMLQVEDHAAQVDQA